MQSIVKLFEFNIIWTHSIRIKITMTYNNPIQNNLFLTKNFDPIQNQTQTELKRIYLQKLYESNNPKFNPSKIKTENDMKSNQSKSNPIDRTQFKSNTPASA